MAFLRGCQDVLQESTEPADTGSSTSAIRDTTRVFISRLLQKFAASEIPTDVALELLHHIHRL